MARVAYAVAPAVPRLMVSEFVCHLALVPKDDAGYRAWSIDEEAIGQTWHDSSWMLRKGLDVIEDLDLDPPACAWDQAWRSAAEPGFPMQRLAALG